MEKQKNIMKMEKNYLQGNIQKEKDGMERDIMNMEK